MHNLFSGVRPATFKIKMKPVTKTIISGITAAVLYLASFAVLASALQNMTYSGFSIKSIAMCGLHAVLCIFMILISSKLLDVFTSKDSSCELQAHN
ncbi:MAG: hypothetical protein CL840_15695 [Crocinitomicaceae bacterium]|nr:hypothetical protein [Crocinitomicaceae bacterium]